MSQYFNFYIRTKSGFIPMQSFSRNNEMYQAFVDIAPYEKVRAIQADEIGIVLDSIKSKTKKLEDNIKRLKEHNQLIASMNNSVDDKIEAIISNDSSIDEIEESIEELKYVADVILYMQDFLNEAEMNYKWEDKEEFSFYDTGKILYIGIESPMHPTESDIVCDDTDVIELA